MNGRAQPARFFFAMQKIVVFLTMLALLLLDLGNILLLQGIPVASAAEVTINDSVHTNGTRHTHTNSSLVFTDNQTGYKFAVDSGTGSGTNGTCVYWKTTDGGVTWGSEVVVDSQTDCQGIVVWYDQWTSGDTGDYVHIITMDSGADDLWYNRLDTSDDSLLLGSSPVSVSSASGQGGSLAAGVNKPTVTKGTDGTLYAAVADNVDSYVVECSSSCNTAGNWSETGTNPMDVSPDWPYLLPLSGGNIMLIYRDRSANDIEFKTWNNTSWSGTFGTIDSNAPENNTYDVGMAAVSNPATNEVYLAYTSDNATLGGDDDIRTATYSGGSWSNGSDILTNDTRGILQVAMSIDENSDDIYVAYTIGTGTSHDIYWASSTSAFSSWGTEQGPVNAASDNIFGIGMNYLSDERLYVAWYEATPDDMLGDTIADVAPGTVVSASGTQVTTVRASTSDFYVGGQFVFEEFSLNRNVTDITITENGTIDASTYLKNVELRYDLDTTAPYDCTGESYDGGEAQFGSTDSNGFSGADGVSTFTGSVTINPTQSMCLYVTTDVIKDATDSSTIEIEISDPSTDVSITGGSTPDPTTVVALNGDTDVVDSDLTQTHFHWRNDDGNETGATSRTAGVQDTNLATLQREVPVRLRFGISNEGSTTSVPTTFRLEYTTTAGSCSAASGWTDIDETDDAWNLSNSGNVTNGDDTTNIANSIGGVDNENTVFLTPNGGQLDTSSETGALTLDTNNWTELEFSIVASSTAVEGNSYCFRLTDEGETLGVYDNYPRVTLSADVGTAATGTQTATVDVQTDDFYIGGAFTIIENTASRNVTAIEIQETGTVDGTNGIADTQLFYDLDTTLPYDCNSESYGGGEAQFGGTLASFTTDNATSSFIGSVGISTTTAMCVYIVTDITVDADDGDTVDFRINSGSSDITVSGGGSVSPDSALDITGSSTITGPIVTQVHYHWRNDDGNETGATSATGGSEDTALADFALRTPVRLRVGLSNEGSTSTQATRYQLEYGIKLSSCSAVAVWTDVDAALDAWDMYDSSNLTNGETTTDINVANGGVSNENDDFVGANGGVRDTESQSGTTTITETEYVDLEFSIQSTKDTSNETDYCFRVTDKGTPLLAYDQYAEISTESRRDFYIQRGTVMVTGTSTTLFAGTHYDAPSSTANAFVRITNTHHTGAGRDEILGGPGGNQNADDYGAYIFNPGNLDSHFTIARDSDSVNNSYVGWEIIEYIGASGSDNEMIVRDHGTVVAGAFDTVATGSVVSTVSDDSDVVVFITGQNHRGGNRTEAFAHQYTSLWSATSTVPVFERGATGNNAGNISYAVVEFTGLNWTIQRAEHPYVAAGVAETEDITAVNSLDRVFLHKQKRYETVDDLDDFGHDVYVSSLGAVTFFLHSGADVTRNHVSVAWVIENTQTGTGAMDVIRNNGASTGGSEPLTISVPLPDSVNDTNNASIFTSSYQNQTGNNFPRAIAGVTLTSTSSYSVWRSDTGGTLSYRTEVVQWPVADLAIRQNYYRFYVDNDALLPTDAWPVGVDSIGENTPITATDEPLADGERVRIRMTVQARNATFPAGLRSFKLQYAQRITSCSAAAGWTDVGDIGSGAIWRGYNTAISDGASLSGDPPTGGDLLISISDVAGRFAEENATVANEFSAGDNEDTEYDWVVEQNGAQQRTTYCFRMINNDDSELDGYLDYPQIRTEGYTPVTQDWRWYDDETNETPSFALAAVNTAPSATDKGNTMKLRWTVNEIENLTQIDARFKVQFSELADFSTVFDVAATSTCIASSTWCYADGAGLDNATVTTSVLADNDGCVASGGDGCGVHNESSESLTGYTHEGGTSIEMEFTLFYTNIEREYGTVYYFRLFDLQSGEPVVTNTGETYPSIVGEPTSLTFTVDGVASSISTEGVTTDVTTTATSIPFGQLLLNTEYEAAHTLNVDTNAIEGYQVLLYATQNLLSSNGEDIDPITGTNAIPAAWSSSCVAADGCFGYHAGDDTLDGGSTRFAPNDTYAAFTASPEEIMYSSIPSTDSEDIIYKLQINDQQPAGDYQTNIVYLVVPVF